MRCVTTTLLCCCNDVEARCVDKPLAHSDYTDVSDDQAPLACLQESIPDEGSPPLPQLLAALRKGFSPYEEKWNSLLREEPAEAISSVQADAGEAASCSDLHEKCPVWAAIVSGPWSICQTTLQLLAVACLPAHHCKHFDNKNLLHARLLYTDQCQQCCGMQSPQLREENSALSCMCNSCLLGLCTHLPKHTILISRQAQYQCFLCYASLTASPQCMYMQGECEKNGEYMVEGHTLAGDPLPGHCQLSCAVCTLHVPSGSCRLLCLLQSNVGSDVGMKP